MTIKKLRFEFVGCAINNAIASTFGTDVVKCMGFFPGRVMGYANS